MLQDIKLACGCNQEFDRYVTNLEEKIEEAVNSQDTQRSARFLADILALAMQGSIMIRYGDSKVSLIIWELSLFLLKLY